MSESASRPTAAAAEAPPSLWRPRRWRAGLLNVVMPGAGQLYNGRQTRAAASVVAFVLWLFVTMAAAVAAPNRLLRITFLLISVLTPWIAFAWDGVRVAARTSSLQRSWFQRWSTLLAIIVLWALVVQPGLVRLTKRYITEAYRIPTWSMEPTLLTGDHVLVSKWDATSPTRGAVVAFVGLAGHNCHIQGGHRSSPPLKRNTGRAVARA